MSQNRQPAGVPTGGQFAASQHAESDVALDTEAGHKTVATPAEDLREGTVVSLDGDLVTVTSLDGDHKSISVEFDHDPDTIASYGPDETFDVVATDDAPISLDTALGDKGMLVVEEHEIGAAVPFHRAHIVRDTNGDGFHVAAEIRENFLDGITAALARRHGYDLSDAEQVAAAENHAAAWLSGRREHVAAHLKDAYDAELNPGTSWDDQAINLYATLGSDARTDQVVDALTEHTRAEDVWHDLYEADTDDEEFFDKVITACD